MTDMALRLVTSAVILLLSGCCVMDCDMPVRLTIRNELTEPIRYCYAGFCDNRRAVIDPQGTGSLDIFHLMPGTQTTAFDAQEIELCGRLYSIGEVQLISPVIKDDALHVHLAINRKVRDALCQTP